MSGWGAYEWTGLALIALSLTVFMIAAYNQKDQP
jgi:heme exporter protein D